MQPSINPQADLALSLTLAVVASSNAPMLLLDGALVIQAASTSFCRSFSLIPEYVDGRPIKEIGKGEWDVRQFQSLLGATARGHADIEAYEMDLVRPGQPDRRLVVKAHRLEYLDQENVRLLVSVVDVTDARLAEKLKEQMLREKAVLLQELQHRVANSLQIIASVLMQSAKRVQSDETRKHLYDAHSRIMSVADVQKQLAVSTLKDVELRPYFTELCQSLGASMIQDHDLLSISVASDGSVATAEVSVSLGLIITELVINALKHAFPGQRNGEISVGYESDGPAWALSVHDDGIGMPADETDAKPGLGTSIVRALALQLEATISVKNAHPGTTVTVTHERVSAVPPPRAV